jgi:hypothetical protein
MALGNFVVFVVNYNESMSWVYLVFLSLPSLLFIISVSLFIYFFALIVMEEESDSTNLLKPFFSVFIVFTILVFLAVTFFFSEASYFENDQYLKAFCGLYGVVFLLFTICMTNYGTRLSLILSNLIEVNDS